MLARSMVICHRYKTVMCAPARVIMPFTHLLSHRNTIIRLHAHNCMKHASVPYCSPQYVCNRRQALLLVGPDSLPSDHLHNWKIRTSSYGTVRTAGHSRADTASATAASTPALLYPEQRTCATVFQTPPEIVAVCTTLGWIR